MGLLLSLEIIFLRSPLEPALYWPISFIRSFQSGLLAGFFFNCSNFSPFTLLIFLSGAAGIPGGGGGGAGGAGGGGGGGMLVGASSSSSNSSSDQSTLDLSIVTRFSVMVMLAFPSSSLGASSSSSSSSHSHSSSFHSS